MERKFEVTENALWKRRGKAIVSKNLNRWRRCPRLASVLREMNRCVVEYQSDDDLIFYDVGLYIVQMAMNTAEGHQTRTDR